MIDVTSRISLQAVKARTSACKDAYKLQLSVHSQRIEPIMKTKLGSLICVLLVVLFTATTAAPQIVTTNLVAAHPDFRIVRGQLYNIKGAVGWYEIAAECRSILSNSLIAQEFVIRKTYEPPKSSYLGSIGAFSGAAAEAALTPQ